MADFASMLKYLREREHLSQRELASKIGVSSSTIGMYESGERFPKAEIEEALADFFNVDLNTLRGKRINENMPEDTPEAKAIREYWKNPPHLDEQRKEEFISLYENVPADVQEAVVNLLKSYLPKV